MKIDQAKECVALEAEENERVVVGGLRNECLVLRR